MGHTFGVRVDGAAPRRFLRFLSLTAFQAEGCGGGFAADLKKGARLAPRVVQKGCTPQGKRLTMICASLALLQIMFAVHRFAQGAGKKVLKMNGPAAQGFLSLTALRAEGCGIALSGDEYEVSVTGFTFSVIGRNKHSADWLAALATPYPGCAGLPPQAGAE